MITNWQTFLPPLVPFTLKNLTNVTTEFKSKLLKDLRSGYKGQQESIQVVQSKIIFYSLRLQEKIQHIVHKEKPLLSNMANQAFIENACCNIGNFKTTIGYFIEKDEEIDACNKIVQELSNTLEDIDVLSKANMLYSPFNTKNIYPTELGEFNEETIYKAFIKFCNFTTLIPIDPNLSSLCNEKPEYLSLNDSIQEMIKKLKNDGKNYTNEMLLRLLQIVHRSKEVNIKLESPIVAQVQRIRDVIENYEASIEDNVVDKSLIDLLNETLDTFDLSIEEDTVEMRKLKNYLARTNKDIKEEIVLFIKKNNNIPGKSQKQQALEQLFNTLMLWGEEKIDDIYELEEKEKTKERDDLGEENRYPNIADDNGYNSIQFMKSYIDLIINVFPKMILNEVDYEITSIPKYWGLSGYHEMDVKNMISEYYSGLRRFYNNTTISPLLNKVAEKGKFLSLLVKETPYFTEIKKEDKTTHSIFDKETANLLFEQYFLLSLLQYKLLSENESIIFEDNTQEEKLENVFDVEDLVAINSENEYNVSELQRESKMKKLQTDVANLLMIYLNIMKDHKDQVSNSYDYVMDKVFKLKEREKDTFTDRLKSLTDEERNVDTILKSNKLGVWSKGLQKGLTAYDPNTYDEERDEMNKLGDIEMKIKKKNPGANEFEVQDALEEAMREEEIDNDAYDMAFMNDDYGDGNFEADEVDDYENYE
jgi:hypothetical protein